MVVENEWQQMLSIKNGTKTYMQWEILVSNLLMKTFLKVIRR
jgi:hypothetical protein